jgi:hypothetical protein
MFMKYILFMFMPRTCQYADYEFGTFEQEKFLQSSQNSHLLEKLRTIFFKNYHLVKTVINTRTQIRAGRVVYLLLTLYDS